jgi:ligand-binding sensor domain-containing protein
VFKHNDKDTTSISGDDVNALYTDRTGAIWIGTDGGGWDKCDGVSGLVETAES